MPDIEPKQGGWFIIYINGLPSSLTAGMDVDSVIVQFRAAILGQMGGKEQRVTAKNIYDAPVEDIVRVTAMSLAILTGVLMAGRGGPRGLV